MQETKELNKKNNYQNNIKASKKKLFLLKISKIVLFFKKYAILVKQYYHWGCFGFDRLRFGMISMWSGYLITNKKINNNFNSNRSFAFAA